MTQHPNGPRCQPGGRTVVISGGTDGMGRALALGRAAQGDRVIAIGSNPAKGARLLADARQHGGDVEFLHADLSTLAGNRGVIEHVTAEAEAVDALILCANRQAPKRAVTEDGLESVFALYYLSRYLLSHELLPALGRATAPVIVNIAGVGATRGRIHWDDLQLEHRYQAVAAQLQAGRANDLLGVAHARRHTGQVPYVLYHPGFTRSGDLSVLPLPLRLLIRGAARVGARPVEKSIAPVHDFIDQPPAQPLTAVDRGKRLPLDLPTLRPDDAARLDRVTAELLAARTENS